MEQKLKAPPATMRLGIPVEVLSPDNKSLFLGRVAEYNGKKIRVNNAGDKRLPIGGFGKTVKLRFEQKDRCLILLGKICRSSSDFWEMDQLMQKSVSYRRTCFRQRVNVLAQVVGMRKDSKPAACTIVDISVTGIQFQSLAGFEIGETVRLLRLKLAHNLPEFYTLECRVRRILKSADGNTYYGCQFESLTRKDQEQLEEVVFALQRAEIRLKKEREF